MPIYYLVLALIFVLLRAMYLFTKDELLVHATRRGACSDAACILATMSDESSQVFNLNALRQKCAATF